VENVGTELCPLLGELAAIGSLHPRSVILIDDARLFLSPPVAPQPLAGWPRLHEIVTALLRLSPDHRLLVVNDVLVFVPAAAEEAVYAFAHRQGVNWLHVYHEAAKVAPGALGARLWRDQLLSLRYWRRLVWNRTFGYATQLVQYPPRPLRLPGHYARTALRSADPPGIALVTPSYQQGVYLARTIESVLAQGYPKLEYVIQDGGSTDMTPRVVEAYRGRLARVVAAPDGGQADAINRGFQGTRGEIMAWLNADDLLLPGTLAYVADYFEAHPEVDVVYGHRIQIDKDDQEIGRWVLPEHDASVLAWTDYVPQETLFWRRRIWEKAGGYVDTSYHFALDWELLLRFQKAGARFVRLPRFLGAFRVHDAQKTSAQLNGIGAEEIARLRAGWHGRPVSRREALAHTFGYLLRGLVLNRLMAWGIVRD
jgi:glycosyltransferase involved in cell wall biosynthesis